MHYIIGDVHGCYVSLLNILDKINFDSNKDKIIFAGDIINRGPDSLKVITLIQSFKTSADIVLGNHELYLLYLLHKNKITINNTLNNILICKQKKIIMHWLKQKKFMLKIKNYFIVHAGIPHIWSEKQAQEYSLELETVLQSNKFNIFIENLYSKNINVTTDCTEVNRWCMIAKYFTMMRFCDKDAQLNLKIKSNAEKNIKKDIFPWFEHINPNFKNKIIFGHWSSINGITNNNNFIALDTGCVWGKKLSAFCIENKKFYRIQC